MTHTRAPEEPRICQARGCGRPATHQVTIRLPGETQSVPANRDGLCRLHAEYLETLVAAVRSDAEVKLWVIE